MTIWANEINELDKLYASFKGNLPDIVKEMEQLIRTDDANVVMLYSRRCLEVIVTDLCETELKRPRKTEPLKGIIDKLNSEEKVPSHIITSMLSLNSMATYGTHPKDFDPEQVKPVLNNLAIIIRWYLKYKDFQVVSKKEPEEKKSDSIIQEGPANKSPKPKKRLIPLLVGLVLVIFIVAVALAKWAGREKKMRETVKFDTLIDSRDGHIYKTVKIGSQDWMAENLKATLYNDGTPISLLENDNIRSKTPAYSWYKDSLNDNYPATYGALYNWYAVNTGKLCPMGWHVPSEAEWTILIDFLGGDVYGTGGKLKEAGKTHWHVIGEDISTNESGFSALPGGHFDDGSFKDIRSYGYWWSTTEIGEDNVWTLQLYSSSNYILTYNDDKYNGLSVRCIKDN